MSSKPADTPSSVALLSGGVAGTCTDLFFFPIDTLKTRLQAKGGFFANGGWKGIYRGLGSVVLASAPGAGLFFFAYEGVKGLELPIEDAYKHMLAASVGEVVACSVRVPSEVVKQRAQAAQAKSSLEAFQAILSNKSGEGVFRGLYRGWTSTIFREIPFTVIQFPLYEGMKKMRANQRKVEAVSSVEASVCGSIAGGIAAALTTPLDVIKTRLMLSKQRTSVLTIAKQIAQEEGYKAFLKGIGPRTAWISAGGAIFLGVYESAKANIFMPLLAQ